ncbi:type VI secretion system tube protein TssD [Aquimarina sp. RZ0]|uniref:type VI secretion system tube protein TssD n=1 Tax=Aquimarina sp. RZ0 TaxID=2607730 RepID=UPI00165ECAD9|nr:type VI secretion system tube protein TssD [Aquimarina sp. RZ0]
MAFLAKLFIQTEERNVLDAKFVYNQLVYDNGRPHPYIQNGKINLSIASTGND